MSYVATHQNALDGGERVLLFLDECFLLWGDCCGYAWGKRNTRVTIPIGNPKERQAFYGGIDARTGEMHLAPYPKAESAATTDFLTDLLFRYPDAKLTICWDNASWHCGEEVTQFLTRVNGGLAPEDWRITLIAFATNDPEQNPIEEVWHQAKTDLRERRLDATRFAEVIDAFETRLERQIFTFPKLRMYEPSRPE
ncbi:MAG: transposase [Chloroflexales bacterium]